MKTLSRNVEKVKIFLLGMITATGMLFLLGANGGVPGVSLPEPELDGVGRYQITSTSTIMGSGLPWFAVWAIDTKTGEVKWVDHPNVPDADQQYGKTFVEMQSKPVKK